MRLMLYSDTFHAASLLLWRYTSRLELLEDLPVSHMYGACNKLKYGGWNYKERDRKTANSMHSESCNQKRKCAVPMQYFRYLVCNAPPSPWSIGKVWIGCRGQHDGCCCTWTTTTRCCDSAPILGEGATIFMKWCNCFQGSCTDNHRHKWHFSGFLVLLHV